MLNIYAPNEEEQQIKFWKRITQHINKTINNSKLKSNKILIGGDFNAYLREIDTLNRPNKKKIKYFTEFIKLNKLKDAYILKNKDKTEFTWHRLDKNSKIKSASRIDTILMSKILCEGGYNIKIKDPGLITDHSKVDITINIKIKLKNKKVNTRKTIYEKIFERQKRRLQ